MTTKKTKPIIRRSKGKKVLKKPSRKSSPPSSKNTRPPVVTLMGHVDHGKTTLLDKIRKSNQVEKEYGGITQHIGAYQITYKKRKITFIDTPGHAAFAKMRAHGAQVTDIVVLVVAVNDGVKPQTREALAHIKAAKAPFLIAFNKIDLPEANVEKVKGELAEKDIVVESYGGKTVAVEVSAKTGKNLDELLEMILLVSDLQDLKADPKGALEAIVIETHQDKRRGNLATILIKNGTLRTGSEVKVGEQKIRIKAMTDENGKFISEALPSSPVEVLGFKELPAIGQIIGKESVPIKKSESKIVVSQKTLTKKETEDKEGEDEEQEEEEKQSVKIVLKADVLGTLEAITGNLSEEVEIIGKGVGEVTESNILLAQTTGATIYAFNTKVSSSAKKLANIEKVEIKTYNIIYKLFEDLEKQVLKILEPTIDEEEVGIAQIIAEFKIKGEHIAGCKVKTGEITKSLPAHLKRGEEIIKEVKIKSLKRGKEDVEKIKAGNECGLTFRGRIDFKINDAIISYRKLEKD